MPVAYFYIVPILVLLVGFLIGVLTMRLTNLAAPGVLMVTPNPTSVEDTQAIAFGQGMTDMMMYRNVPPHPDQS